MSTERGVIVLCEGEPGIQVEKRQEQRWGFTFRSCVTFLLLLSQMITSLVTYNNTNLFSYSSEGQKSKLSLTGLKSSCWQGCVSSGGSREGSFPCLFQLIEAAHIPSPPLIFKGSDHITLPSAAVFTSPLCLYLSCFPLSFLRTLVFTLGPHGNPGQPSHLRIFNLITFSMSFLTRKVIYARFLRFGEWHLWGVIVLPTTFSKIPVLSQQPLFFLPPR